MVHYFIKIIPVEKKGKKGKKVYLGMLLDSGG